jgi:hypothetical protein
MERMDDLHHRLAALEQETAALKRHSQVIERRLRLWRGAAGAIAVMMVLVDDHTDHKG